MNQRLAPLQKRRDDLEKLQLVDWTAKQLIVDFDVRRDRSALAQRGYVLGVSLDVAGELSDVSTVAQRLNPTGGSARPDRDQDLGTFANLEDALTIVLGCDRAFDE